MKLFTLISIFFVLSSCRLEKNATDWNVTIAPQSGDNANFETNMNTPVQINYQINPSAEGISEHIVVAKSPQYGRLSNCKQTQLTLSCMYHPNSNFVGTDQVMLKVRDGDFESKDSSYLTILVKATSPPIPVNNIGQVVLNCKEAQDNNTLQVAEYSVNFPAVNDCRFNENGTYASDLNIDGNGPRKNQKIRARVEQYFNINLPSKGTICDINFHFPQTSMQYDDEIFLTLNNYVLMASQNYSTQSGSEYYNNGLKVNQNGLMEYKWSGENSLYNLHYGRAVTPKYCLGLNASDPNYNNQCNIPPTETNGQFKLDIPSREIINLSLASSKGEVSSPTELNFGFISTGDDDDGDCEHSAYQFDITVKFMN